MDQINKTYWDNRYRNGQTGWNIGDISTPLKTYFDQLKDKSLKILIPGAGNAYEAEYLWQNGFKNVFVLDLAKQPLDNFKKREPSFPSNQLINSDFFEMEGAFDLIIEQTFFCALQPSLRQNYVNQAHGLLSPHGKIVGLLFNFELTHKGPPFGGSQTEYLTLFTPKFEIKTLEPSINSIKQRQGKELFFIFERLT